MKARRKSIAQQGRMHVRRKLAELTDEINNERQLKTRLKLSLQHADNKRHRLEEKVDQLADAYTQLECTYLGALDDLVYMEQTCEDAHAQFKRLRTKALSAQQEQRAAEYLLDKTRISLINARIIAAASSGLALGYLPLYTGVL